ncbi:MAG TPA: oligosaccharide flippase family protein [Sedimentisphaerales bacterium]|nr:oligosaccharide flippase family protein [Sedimentisphaerales bacterium]
MLIKGDLDHNVEDGYEINPIRMEAVANWVILNWRRVLSWFRDDVFRRLFVNAGKLLSANVVAALLGVVTTVLTARALGPQDYGVLALVLVYELTIGKLVTFNAWQAVIKFGSDALARKDLHGLRQLIKFGFCLDFGSAIIGTLLAMVLAGPVINLLGWSQSLRPLLVLYSVLILFSLGGTPVGILRLFDRFDLLSNTAILSAVIRLVGVLWCLMTRQSLLGFVFVYLVTGIVGQLYQVLASLYMLRRQGEILCFIGQSLVGLRGRFPSILSFVVVTNINTTLKTIFQEGSALIIAGLTNPAALGYYKISQQFTKPLMFVSDSVNQSVYPELTRLWAAGAIAEFFSLLKRTVLILSGVALCGWILFLILGTTLISLFLGTRYSGIFPLMLMFLLVGVVSMIGTPLPAAMYAVGFHRKVTFIYCSGMLLYFILLFPLTKSMSIEGAVTAYFIYTTWWLLMMVLFLRSRTPQKAGWGGEDKSV